tara:strand:- start:39 stop:749 length:711 start_codon:yes stop_codon:yes gene_type:complete
MQDKTVKVGLFRTTGHPCSYLEDRIAATLFLDPTLKIGKQLHTAFSKQGYRRSGELLYKPDCKFCNACISCRIPIINFKLRKSYQRIFKRNQDLEVTISRDLNYSDSYALYESYINNRHSDGDMFPASEEQFKSFILKKTDETVFFNFFDQGRLVAVSVVDILSDGLSAVYSFYEPFEKKRSLGTYSILHLANYASKKELSYLYLGYWVKGCPKMHYKIKFRPLEMLIDGEWLTIN